MKTRLLSPYLSCLATAVFTSAIGNAATINLNGNIVNPSFESPPITGGVGAFNNGASSPAGWGKGTDVGVHRVGENTAPTTGSDGTQLAFLGNGNNFTNLFQDATADAIYGDSSVISYTFTIAIARRGFGGESTNGTFFIGIDDITNGPTVTTAILRSALTSTEFQDFSVTFPANEVGAGDILRLFIDKSAGNSLIVVDNVRLVANTVPEPGTAMLGLAGGALLLRRRRR